MYVYGKSQISTTTTIIIIISSPFSYVAGCFIKSKKQGCIYKIKSHLVELYCVAFPRNMYNYNFQFVSSSKNISITSCLVYCHGKGSLCLSGWFYGDYSCTYTLSTFVMQAAAPGQILSHCLCVNFHFCTLDWLQYLFFVL